MLVKRSLGCGVVAALVVGIGCAGGAPEDVAESQSSPLTFTEVSVASQTQEVCKVSNTAVGGVNDLSCNYDMFGADLGITVYDESRTWVLFGDTIPMDAHAWPANADATGYFNGTDPQSGLCGSTDLVMVEGLTSSQTCSANSFVYAPDPVFLSQPWSATISDFVFNPVAPPADSAGSVPSNAAVPGAWEVPTGAFAYDGVIYTFYSGAPPAIGVPGLSYLTAWSPPSAFVPRARPPRYAPAAVTAPFSATESRQIVSMVDFVGAPPTGDWSTSDTFGGKFVQVAPVVSGGYVYLFGTGTYRNSLVYLARLALPEDGGALAFSQYLSQTPGFEVWNGNAWDPSPGDAAPLSFGDDASPDFGEISVQQFSAQGVWLMMYAPTRQGSDWGNVMVRWSSSPSGPWSNMMPVFSFLSSANESAYCCSGAPPGGCTGQQVLNCPGGTPYYEGYAFYAPYMLPTLTPVSGDTYTVSYMLSSFSAYTTLLMSFDLNIEKVTVSPLPCPWCHFL